MNRVATLDGAAAFNDFGYSEADRTLTVTWRPRTEAETSKVARLFRLHGLVRVCQGTEAWLAVPERFTPARERSTATFLVREKLA